MALDQFTTGRAVTLTIVTASGPLTLALVTGFQSKQDSVEQKIKGLDGVTRHVRFFDGWSGTFNVERQDSTVDDYFSQLEQNYYSGVLETPASITETIAEVDGSISQYRYQGVLLKLDDAGEYRGDQSVKQALSFVASRRVQIQ